MNEDKERFFPESAIREALDGLGFTGDRIDKFIKDVVTYSVMAEMAIELREAGYPASEADHADQ